MEDEKIFNCPDCGKNFTQEQSMLQHRNDAHKVSQQHTTKRTFRVGKILPYVIGVMILAGIIGVVYWAVSSSSNGIGAIGSTHIHTDFAIFLDGQEITPLSHRYFVRSPYVHVESGPGEGTVIHMHATNVPLNFFFKSLGMEFISECFKLDDGRQSCNSEDKTLKMFVRHNGESWQQNSEYGDYIFKDLDKILITYGNENQTEIQKQQNSVTDFSKDNSALQ